MAPTPPKSTTTTPSSKKKSGSRKRQVPEETSDMADPAATASGIKRRRSAAGRSLIRWDFEKDQLLLLALEYECAKLGQPLPWDEAVKHVKEGASGQAVVQHLAKVRKYRIENGQPVPPEPLKRRLPKPRQPAGRSSKVLNDDVTDDDEDDYIAPFKGSKSRMVFAPINDPNPKTPRNKITLSQPGTPAPPALRRRLKKSVKEEDFDSQEEFHNNDPDAAQDSEDEWKPDEEDASSAPAKKRRGRPARLLTTTPAGGLPVHRHEISKVDHEESEINEHGESQDADRHEFRSKVPAFNDTIERFNRRASRLKKEFNKLAKNRDLSSENGIVKEQPLEDPFARNQPADANATQQSEHVEQARQAIVGYDIPWTEAALSPPGSPTPSYNVTYQPMMNVPRDIAGPRDANIGPLFRHNPSMGGLAGPASQLDIDNYNISRGWTNPLFRPNIGGPNEATPRLWSNPMLNPPVLVGTHIGGSQMLPHDVQYWDWSTGSVYDSIVPRHDPQSLANTSMGVYNDSQSLTNASMEAHNGSQDLSGYCDSQGLTNGPMAGYHDQRRLVGSMGEYNNQQGLTNGPMAGYSDQQGLTNGPMGGYNDLIDYSGGQPQQFDMGLADINFCGMEYDETLREGGDGSYEDNQTIAPMLLSNYDPTMIGNQGIGMGDNNASQDNPTMNDNQGMGMGDPQNNPPYGDMLSFAGFDGISQNQN
ncbi:hypothetical protein BDV97DRAFT_416585 [Delphinella strobiligena]|nr:hypothetical protein BDV97DRAFT_416585 [Delphinella strobiligena]